MKKITIAIDGFSSCGKSTMAKMLAKEVGYIYVDTGAMYRAVTLFAMRNGMIAPNGDVNRDALKAKMDALHVEFKLNPQTGKAETYLNGENVEHEIRGMEVSAHVSAIAAIDFVRTALVAQQQRMGHDKGIVMDGRDIGTVVFPDAQVKLFLDASAEERAKRRYNQLQNKGISGNFAQILAEIKERDLRDRNRAVAPLKPADDAFLLDSTTLSIDEVIGQALDYIQQRIGIKA